MVSTYRGQPELSMETISLLQCFCSQSGDCWGMIGSRSATNRALYLAHRTGIWGSFSRRRSATKQGEHRRRNQEQVDILVGFVLFHWEPQDRQYVRENESRVRVGSKRTNDTEAGGFWELIGKGARAEKKHQGRRSNHSDPITLIETESAGNINLKAKATNSIVRIEAVMFLARDWFRFYWILVK